MKVAVLREVLMSGVYVVTFHKNNKDSTPYEIDNADGEGYFSLKDAKREYPELEWEEIDEDEAEVDEIAIAYF